MMQTTCSFILLWSPTALVLRMSRRIICPALPAPGFCQDAIMSFFKNLCKYWNFKGLGCCLKLTGSDLLSLLSKSLSHFWWIFGLFSLVSSSFSGRIYWSNSQLFFVRIRCIHCHHLQDLYDVFLGYQSFSNCIFCRKSAFMSSKAEKQVLPPQWISGQK